MSMRIKVGGGLRGKVIRVGVVQIRLPEEDASIAIPAVACHSLYCHKEAAEAPASLAEAGALSLVPFPIEPLTPEHFLGPSAVAHASWLSYSVLTAEWCCVHS